MQTPQLQKPVQQALYAAIRKGDLKTVSQCLAQGADPNAREIRLVKPSLEDTSGKDTEEGDTPLILALESQEQVISEETRVEMARLLLDKGADINKPWVADLTPLMEAVRFYHPGVALLLLQRGAKPDLQDGNGETALNCAVREGRVDMAELLIRHGANVNGSGNSKAWTPLINAAQEDRAEIVELLLKHKADPNIRRWGRTALEWALIENRKNPDVKAVELLRRAGGKGRTLAEMKPELDREDRDFDRELKASTQKRDAERQVLARRYRKEAMVTAEDSLLIQTALLDMLAYQGNDLHVPATFRNKPNILVADRTAPGPPYESQMNGELSIEQANDITREMRQHLMQRNYKTVSLKRVLRFSNRHIQVIPQDDKKSTIFGWFEKSYPTARFVLTLYLPGYNPAHDRAVLRFWFGPSFHGAAGTTFLVKAADGWRVVWRQFSFFV